MGNVDAQLAVLHLRVLEQFLQKSSPACCQRSKMIQNHPHDFLKTHDYLIPNGRMPAEMRIAAGKIRAAVDDIQRLCDEQRMELLLTVHPTQFELFSW